MRFDGGGSCGDVVGEVGCVIVIVVVDRRASVVAMARFLLG